jgi:hypothetical protein
VVSENAAPISQRLGATHGTLNVFMHFAANLGHPPLKLADFRSTIGVWSGHDVSR